jgi:hypothetical protein
VLLPLTLTAGAGCKNAPPPLERAPYAWVNRFGAAGGAALPRFVALDPAGDLLLTGSYEGSLDFGAAPQTSAAGGSLFVVKLDGGGRPVWSAPWALPSASDGYAVGADPTGNVLVVAHGGAAAPNAPLDDFFLAKLDSSGNKLWQTPLTFVGAYAPVSLAVSGGGFSLLSARAADAFLMAMVDPTGAQCWGLSFPLTCKSQMAGIATNASSQSAVTGSYDCPVNFGPGPLASNGQDSAFVATFDANGNPLWSRGFGDSAGAVTGRAVTEDDAGDVFVAGDYTGSPDFGGGPLHPSKGGLFVLALDSKGAHLFSRGYDGATVAGGGSLAVAPSGAIYVMATASAPVDLGGSIPEPPGTFLFMLTSKGAYGGANRFAPEEGSSSFVGAGISAGAQGQVAFAGSLTGTVAFGGTSLSSVGASDLVAGLLAP